MADRRLKELVVTATALGIAGVVLMSGWFKDALLASRRDSRDQPDHAGATSGRSTRDTCDVFQRQ